MEPVNEGEPGARRRAEQEKAGRNNRAERELQNFLAKTRALATDLEDVLMGVDFVLSDNADLEPGAAAEDLRLDLEKLEEAVGHVLKAKRLFGEIIRIGAPKVRDVASWSKKRREQSDRRRA